MVSELIVTYRLTCACCPQVPIVLPDKALSCQSRCFVFSRDALEGRATG